MEPEEVRGNNRSVMPLDVLGRTRVTLAVSIGLACLKRFANPQTSPCLGLPAGIDGMNEEFLVGASHQLAPNTSLPFVHTARRYYRLSLLLSCMDWRFPGVSPGCAENCRESVDLEEVKVVTRFP